jgi:septum formation protein
MNQSEAPVLILASRSPRRADLLRALGIEFEICPAEVSETVPAETLPRHASLLLAQFKARAVAKHFPQRLVLGADTVVSIDDRILGKPQDAVEAKRILEALSGRWHTVWTGICLCHLARRFEISDVVSSSVRFRTLSDREIDEYIASGEPLDKAGAYGIQGKGGELVEELEGSLENVIGLPTTRVVEILKEHSPEFFPRKRT